MPDVFRNAMGSSQDAPQDQQPPYDRGRDPRDRDPRDARDSRDTRDYRDSRDHAAPESRHAGYGGEAKQAFVPAMDDGPEYASREEAQAAFTKVLKRTGVQPEWTWQQAMRAAIIDPQYRAIKDPRDRREAFEKYCQDMIVHDQERAEERIAKLRADFGTMLKRHPEIVHYTRWRTARPIIEGEVIFKSTDKEEERRQLYQEYIAGLKKAHRERQTNRRKDALEGLRELLPKLNIKAYTRWNEAQEILSAATGGEEKYQALTKYDTLTTFQDHIKALERALNEQKQQEKKMKYRRERQNRDAFKSLLSELRRDAKIRPGTTWSNIVPLIESDERYINMMGQDGSTPQELFWDIAEEEERSLRGPRNDVLDVIGVSLPET